MKRQRKGRLSGVSRVSREAIKFRTGEPLSYGSNWKLPRPQERVPRSVLSRSLIPDAKSRIARLSPAKRTLVLQGRPKALVRSSPVSRKVQGRFVFRSPFFLQQQQLQAVGRMVRNPKRVLFCVKRKIRREVLFAFRKAGRSGSGPGRRGKYRRNGNSLHGC